MPRLHSRLPRIKKALFGLVAVLLALGLLEGAARVLEGVWPVRRFPLPSPGANFRFAYELQARRLAEGGKIPMIADLQRRWAMAPGELIVDKHKVRINSLGLRGPALAPPRPGELRLMTLGDSSIFGVCTAEEGVFSAVAASRLSRRWGRTVTAVNGGIPGYDSAQSLTLLRQKGPRVKPTFVVIGNIWSDVYAGARGIDTQPGALAALTARSALSRRLQSLLRPEGKPQEVRFMASREDIGATSGDGPRPRVSPEEYRQNLISMVQQARQLGARPVLLMLPAPMDFDAVPPPATIGRFRQLMSQVAARHGVPLLDGREVFRTVGSGLWFVDQAHPSPEGHLLLGRALADLLASRYGPPPAP